jgi:serine protease AprX
LFRKLLLILPAVLLAGLVLAPMGIAASPGSPPGRVLLDSTLPVHPYLQYGAQAEPNKRVRVIVQKTSPLVDSDGLGRSVGASVLKEHPIVNGLVLEVPQRVVPVLARQPGVRYVSLDGAVSFSGSVDTSQLKTVYQGAISLPQVWNGSGSGSGATGNGVTVAVLDSGVNSGHPDLKGSNLVVVKVNPKALGGGDGHGHGTHVVGIVKGRDPYGRYIGAAPDARVISVKIADDTGAATEGDLLDGLQWVNDNRLAYNIRAVNLSVNAAIPQSYKTSAIAAAVETLWMNGVAVVVASGNKGTQLSNQTWYAPANDPFVITVGALDDNLTAGTADDSLAPFSSRGVTQDGFYKPEIVAPGRKIVAPLASGGATLAKEFPDRITDTNYIRLSGTSMAAPVVTGVVALLLERYPTLTPNQVKWLLQQTANPYPGKADSAGVVDPVEALQVAATGKLGQANQGLVLNSGLTMVPGTATTNAYWDSAYWNQAYWDSAYWDQAYWDQAAGFDSSAVD